MKTLRAVQIQGIPATIWSEIFCQTICCLKK